MLLGKKLLGKVVIPWRRQTIFALQFTNMLVLDKLTKKFDGETILDSLSFTFDDTGLYFLKGENGSGKSTLLSILAGKDESYDGKLFYNECLINNKNKNDYADNHVTYVPQNSFVLEDETVLDNVLLPYNRKEKDKQKCC